MIEVLDVTARDGLQNEKRMFSTSEKLDLITRAVTAGAKRLEIASFAHPKYVPQMADAEAVIEGVERIPDVTYIGLVMNARGLDRALKTKIDEIGFVVVASDTFAQKNQNQTCQGSVDLACELIARAKQAGLSTNVTIAASFGCPFDGEVPEGLVVDMAKQLSGAKPREISIADTIGVGNPWHVKSLVSKLREELPDMPLRGHFHNTRNTGLANSYAAIEAGITTLDVSIGGIGGCPFAPAATGNIPSEDLIYMLERNGIKTGMHLEHVIQTAQWLSEKMEHALPGMVSKAGGFPASSKIAAK